MHHGAEDILDLPHLCKKEVKAETVAVVWEQGILSERVPLMLAKQLRVLLENTKTGKHLSYNLYIIPGYFPEKWSSASIPPPTKLLEVSFFSSYGFTEFKGNSPFSELISLKMGFLVDIFALGLEAILWTLLKYLVYLYKLPLEEEMGDQQYVNFPMLELFVQNRVRSLYINFTNSKHLKTPGNPEAFF